MAYTRSTASERRAMVAELIASNRWNEHEVQKLRDRFGCSRRTLFNDRAKITERRPRQPDAPVVQLAPPPRPAVASIDLSSASLLDVYGWLLQRLAGELEAGDMRDTARVAAYREIRSVAVDLHDLRNAERPDEVSTSAEELEARMTALVSRLPASLRRSIG